MTTVQDFADLVLEQTKARVHHDYPTKYNDGTEMADTYEVHVIPGKVYTKVDVGPHHNMSGKYMVDNATGVIYGIKGYGKVHKGHAVPLLKRCVQLADEAAGWEQVNGQIKDFQLGPREEIWIRRAYTTETE